jgi:hypothetical protein
MCRRRAKEGKVSHQRRPPQPCFFGLRLIRPVRLGSVGWKLGPIKAFSRFESARRALVAEEANLLARSFAAVIGEDRLTGSSRNLLLHCRLLLLLLAYHLVPCLLRCISLWAFACGGPSGSLLLFSFCLPRDLLIPLSILLLNVLDLDGADGRFRIRLRRRHRCCCSICYFIRVRDGGRHSWQDYPCRRGHTVLRPNCPRILRHVDRRAAKSNNPLPNPVPMSRSEVPTPAKKIVVVEAMLMSPVFEVPNARDSTLFRLKGLVSPKPAFKGAA